MCKLVTMNVLIYFKKDREGIKAFVFSFIYSIIKILRKNTGNSMEKDTDMLE